MHSRIIAQKSSNRYKITTPNQAPNLTATVAWVKEFLQMPAADPLHKTRTLLNLWRSTGLPQEEFLKLVAATALELKGGAK